MNVGFFPGLFFFMSVLSSFKYGPQEIRPVLNDVLIAKLRPGQVR